MKNYIKDALKIDELNYDLQNISSSDNKEVEEYTQKEVIDEAEYVLSCFYEGGHSLNEDLNSENKKIKEEAEKQTKQLKKYIDKYK